MKKCDVSEIISIYEIQKMLLCNFNYPFLIMSALFKLSHTVAFTSIMYRKEHTDTSSGLQCWRK